MIKIDMDMPKNCDDCIFNTNMLGFGWCCINIKYTYTSTGEKPDWCPLIEDKDYIDEKLRGLD